MGKPKKILIACVITGFLVVALLFLYLFFTTGAAYYAWHNFLYPAQQIAKFGDVSKLDSKSINSQDDEGMTPLAWAIVQERPDAVRLLLDKGADPNIPNKNGLTPLDHACGRNKAVGKQLAELLLAKGAEVNPKNADSTPLSWAVASDNTELVALLLERGADPKARGGYILRSAADRGDTEIAAMLIAHGADPKAMSDGTTPLHDAAQNGREEVMKLLLSKGADINARQNDGTTPLLYAAGRGQKGCVEILLANGADVNATDTKGNTAISFAAASGYTNIVELLRQHGAKK